MIKPKILIIDDNGIFVDNLSFLLQNDFDCSGVYTAEDGISILSENHFDVILLDIKLGSGLDGIEFLEKIHKQQIFIPTIMITGDKSIDMVVKAMKAGAYDYVGKDPDLSELKIIINRALNEFGLRRENELLREEIQQLKGQFVGESPAIRSIRQQIQKLAPLDSTVLISGDSGTGKEVVARNIHQLSKRKNKPFITLNCAAIPKELFESEFFGHEKGAFTGAYKARKGKFELANHGTIFLDEIGELEISVQAKLLRVLEEKKIELVGGSGQIEVGVRIIAASNKDLKKAVENGKFREDLFYRLNIVQIFLPPLRERKEDIPLLVHEFIDKKSKELKKNVKGITEQAMNSLIAYDWPGNVRELQNVIEKAIIYTDGDLIQAHTFDGSILPFSSELPDYASAKQTVLQKFQKQYISAMLKLTNGNKTKAAERMGLTRQGLQKMMDQLREELEA